MWEYHEGNEPSTGKYQVEMVKRSEVERSGMEWSVAKRNGTSETKRSGTIETWYFSRTRLISFMVYPFHKIFEISNIQKNFGRVHSQFYNRKIFII